MYLEVGFQFVALFGQAVLPLLEEVYRRGQAFRVHSLSLLRFPFSSLSFGLQM